MANIFSSLPTSSTPSLVGSITDKTIFDENVNAPDMVARYSDAFNSRVLVAPEGVQQIGAFAFDYKGADMVSMDNEVTDYWLEDNTAVQDHIGVKPITITLSGFVSELALSSSLLSSISSALGAVQNTLTKVNNYTGNYTPGTIVSMQQSISQAQNIAVQIEQAAAKIAQVASFFQNGPAANKQQLAYLQLSSLREARVVFTVYTPFQVFFNMAITSLKSMQDEKTKTMSNFTVTMKQLNLVGAVRDLKGTYGGRAAVSKSRRSFNGAMASGKTAVFSAVKNSFAPLTGLL